MFAVLEVVSERTRDPMFTYVRELHGAFRRDLPKYLDLPGGAVLERRVSDSHNLLTDDGPQG